MTEPLDPLTVRDQYDAQLRTWLPARLPAGRGRRARRSAAARRRGVRARVRHLRLAGRAHRADLDALIARQRDHFAALGQAVEWKLHGHDEPADLAERLRAAGFEPEDRETVVVGRAAPLADPHAAAARRAYAWWRSPPGPTLTRSPPWRARVWGGDHSAPGRRRWRPSWPPTRPARRSWSPGPATRSSVRGLGPLHGRYGVRQPLGRLDPRAVAAAGASTRPWCAYRAALAVERGYRYLQVDASDDSRPILQRLGFVAVTTTTPYVLHPVARSRDVSGHDEHERPGTREREHEQGEPGRAAARAGSAGAGEFGDAPVGHQRRCRPERQGHEGQPGQRGAAPGRCRRAVETPEEHDAGGGERRAAPGQPGPLGLRSRRR